MGSRPHHTQKPWWVNTQAEIEQLAALLADQPSVAMDTESDGFFRYRARLCLLQLAAPGVEALVDTLADVDLRPLATVLSDPHREVIAHDAEGDLALLATAGIVPGKLFDTAQAARLVGGSQPGLATLAEAVLGIKMDKSEQRSDWGRRPLSEKQQHYALEDVRHLHTIRDHLIGQLTAAGRLDWAVQTFERVRLRTLVPKPVEPEAWRDMKGARDLDAAGRGLLRVLHAWREAVAQQMDVAPFRVIAPQAMVAAARKCPQTLAELVRAGGMHPQVARGPHAAALLAQLQAATPVDGPLHPPRPPPTQEALTADARFEALRALRSQQAKAMGVDVGALMSNQALRTLASAVPADLVAMAALDALLPWQLEAVGPAVLQVLAAPVELGKHRGGRSRRP